MDPVNILLHVAAALLGAVAGFIWGRDFVDLILRREDKLALAELIVVLFAITLYLVIWLVTGIYTWLTVALGIAYGFFGALIRYERKLFASATRR